MMIQWEHFNFEFNQFTNEWEENDEEESSNDLDIEQMSIEDFLEDAGEYKGAISTPWGIFNITDPFAPYKRFDMWIGNTDFNVSTSFLTKVSKISGIEMVKAISRYTFIIGIGKLFSFDEVRLAIEMAGGVKSQDIPNEIHDLIISFGEKRYAVYVYPNKKFEYTTETDTDYKSKVEKFYEEKRKNKGIILSNG
jgi:hypothetical protein